MLIDQEGGGKDVGKLVDTPGSDDEEEDGLDWVDQQAVSPPDVRLTVRGIVLIQNLGLYSSGSTSTSGARPSASHPWRRAVRAHAPACVDTQSPTDGSRSSYHLAARELYARDLSRHARGRVAVPLRRSLWSDDHGGAPSDRFRDGP